MASVWHEALRTVRPEPGGRHGPLPPLLLALTVVTGLVDAVSYLGLGHVFVANMTGNVVIIGFALAGAQGFSISASVTALAAFCLGAAIGGRIARWIAHRGRALFAVCSLQALLVATALTVAAATGEGPAARHTVLALTATAMGAQNAVARALAVPDLITTVLTLTLTGVFADGPLGGGHGARAGRRLLAAVAMLLGALVGALLVLHHGAPWGLGAALAVLLGVALAAGLLSRSAPPWSGRG